MLLLYHQNFDSASQILTKFNKTVILPFQGAKMITYNIKDIHKDIKYLLQPHGRKALWKPRYYKQLKEYILPDMIRLNQLCNQDGFRSFAVCVNDFMFQDAHGKPRFDMKKLDNLCKQNFGRTLEQAVSPQIIKDSIRDIIKVKSPLAGMVPRMKLPMQGIVFYSVFNFYPTNSIIIPFHEYAHILDLKYSFFKNTKTYLNLSQAANRTLEHPDNPDNKKILQQYLQEYQMLKESFADCFAYSYLALKEPKNKDIYREMMYHISGKFCHLIQNKRDTIYCGFAVTRTMFNRIQFDCIHNNMQKYYLSDGSIDFLNLANTCAEVVRHQAYNHENFHTLSTVPIQEPQNLSHLKPTQYDQWYWDYLDAQRYQKECLQPNPYYRFFTCLGEIALHPKEKANFYNLLDKYKNLKIQPYLNEYRKILKPQLETPYQPQNLAQLIKQQKSRK